MGLYRFFAKEFGWHPRDVDRLSLEEMRLLPMVEYAHKQAQAMLEEQIADEMRAQK